MDRVVSTLKKRRYEVLRYLYNNPLSNKELLSMVNMEQRELVSAVGSLLRYGAIEKETAVQEVEPSEETKLAAEAIGIPPKEEKKITKYVMSERGLNLLAFYEYISELGNYISFPSIFESETYRKDMWERIRKNDYFKGVYNYYHPDHPA